MCKMSIVDIWGTLKQKLIRFQKLLLSLPAPFEWMQQWLLMEQMIDVAGSHFAHCTLEVFAQATVTMAMSGHKSFLIRNVQN